MRFAVLAPVLCCVSCVPSPPSYTVPSVHVHTAADGSLGGILDAFFRVQDADADMFLVKDVEGLEGADMRWTHAEPEFRFFLPSAAKFKFVSSFTVHSVTFKDTGPLQLVFAVNGQEFAREVYKEPGRKRFEQPVPPALLRAGENRVRIKIVNPWIASDGAVLGVVLHSAGFVE